MHHYSVKNQDKETEVSKTSKTSKRTDQEELADPDDSLVDKKKEELKVITQGYIFWPARKNFPPPSKILPVFVDFFAVI